MDILARSDTEIIKSFMDNAADFISALPHQVEPFYRHHFYPGIYIRQMLLPFDGIHLIGKVHKEEHPFILQDGRILIYDGIHEPVILTAPYTGRTMPGAQKFGISLSPVMWSDIHVTDIRPKDDSEEAILESVNKIEKMVVEPFKNNQTVNHNLNLN